MTALLPDLVLVYNLSLCSLPFRNWRWRSVLTTNSKTHLQEIASQFFIVLIKQNFTFHFTLIDIIHFILISILSGFETRPLIGLEYPSFLGSLTLFLFLSLSVLLHFSELIMLVLSSVLYCCFSLSVYPLSLLDCLEIKLCRLQYFH